MPSFLEVVSALALAGCGGEPPTPAEHTPPTEDTPVDIVSPAPPPRANPFAAPGEHGVGIAWSSPNAGLAVKIEDTSLRIDDTEAPRVGACEAEPQPVAGRFRVHLRRKVENVTAEKWWQGAKVTALFFDAAGARIKGAVGVQTVDRTVGTSDWEALDVLVTAPSGAAKAQLCAEMKGADSGTYWLQDVVIEPLPDSPGNHHNALVIVIDTLRAEALGTYGAKAPTSPNIDAFARDAAVFEHAWAQYTWTCPSFVSYMTSRYARTHGWDYIVREWKTYAPMDETVATITDVLRGAGYPTIGYYSNPNIHPRYAFDRGFDVWQYGADKRVEELAVAEINRWPDDGVPNFLYAHFMQPHHPLHPSKDAQAAVGVTLSEESITYFDPKKGGWTPKADSAAFIEAYRDAYTASVWDADRAVGNLLKALDASGLADDTVVFIFSDHGELLGEHELIGHGPYVWEELTRVPLMVRGPGVEPGRVSDRMGELIDMAPTLLDLLGLQRTRPAQWQGKNMLRDDGPEVAVCERDYEAVFTLDGRTKLRSDRNAETPSAWFDLGADPDELNPLSEAPGSTELLAAARAWRDAAPEGDNLSAPPDLPEAEQAARFEELKALGYVE